MSEPMQAKAATPPDIATRIAEAIFEKWSVVEYNHPDTDYVPGDAVIAKIREVITKGRIVVIEPQTAQEAIHEALEAAPLPTWNEIKAGQEETAWQQPAPFRQFVVVIDGKNPPKQFYGKIVSNTFAIDKPEESA